MRKKEKSKKEKKNVIAPTIEFADLIKGEKTFDLMQVSIVEDPNFVRLIDFALDRSSGFVSVVRYLLTNGGRKIAERSLWAKAKGNRIEVKKLLIKYGEMAKNALEGNKIDNTGDAIILGALIIGLAGANMKDCDNCDKRATCKKSGDSKTPCEEEDRNIPGYG
jgi:hypothetical protein